MKSTAVFLGILFGLSFLASGVMLVTATMKPQWFVLGAHQTAADSLQTGAKRDSSAAVAVRSDSAAILPETAASPASSAPASQASAAAPAQTASPAPADTTASKREELLSLVKLYDAMKPEDAAKILAKQPDKDVRAIILHLKKKQAAKILSNFNAERAAQILAQ